MKRVIYFALPGHTGINHCRLARHGVQYQLLFKVLPNMLWLHLLITKSRSGIYKMFQSGITEPMRWGLDHADSVQISRLLNDTG